MPHSQLAHQQDVQEFGLEWQLVLKHGVLAPDGKGNGGTALKYITDPVRAKSFGPGAMENRSV